MCSNFATRLTTSADCGSAVTGVHSRTRSCIASKCAPSGRSSAERMGSGSPRWTTSLAEPRASGAVLWDVGTVRWLRPVDPKRRVRRAGRHDEQRLNDERHGALIPERADVLHRQKEAGAGGVFLSDAAAVGG